MSAVVVPTALLAPGACFISGDPNGPFIDTNVSVPGRGRIYLSLKHIGPLMREAGWVPEAEVADLLATVEEFDNATTALNAEAQGFRNIVAALEPLLPKPEPVVEQVAAFKDAEVGAENKALQSEINDLRQALDATAAELLDAQAAAPPAPTSEGSAQVEPGAAATSLPETIEVKGQPVDLQALLAESVKTIVSVVEGWPDEAINAVLAADAAGQNRSTLRDELGS